MARVIHPELDRRCKLNWLQVGLIRRLRGRFMQEALAEMFGVTQQNISHVQLEKTWK